MTTRDVYATYTDLVPQIVQLIHPQVQLLHLPHPLHQVLAVTTYHSELSAQIQQMVFVEQDAYQVASGLGQHLMLTDVCLKKLHVDASQNQQSSTRTLICVMENATQVASSVPCPGLQMILSS